MSNSAKGIWAMVAACTIWGLSPLYYKLIVHVPPLEVLSHRTLWSLAFFGLVLMVQGRMKQVPSLLAKRRALVMVAIASVMISANWFIFILSIQLNRAVEASLGYYIFPLTAVILGRIFFAEKLGNWQWAAVGLAVLAVSVLTVGLGAAPYVSLAIALTFGFYGVVKKNTAAGPVVSVTAEVLLLAPLALIWLAGVHLGDWQGLVGRSGGEFGADLSDSLILMASGPITAGPLILFSYASRRITMATLGLVQYLNPTLQFSCAVLVFAEPVTRWHALAFPLIWLALTIYSLQAFARERSSRKLAVSEATSGATRT